MPTGAIVAIARNSSVASDTRQHKSTASIAFRINQDTPDYPSGAPRNKLINSPQRNWRASWTL